MTSDPISKAVDVTHSSIEASCSAVGEWSMRFVFAAGNESLAAGCNEQREAAIVARISAMTKDDRRLELPICRVLAISRFLAAMPSLALCFLIASIFLRGSISVSLFSLLSLDQASVKALSSVIVAMGTSPGRPASVLATASSFRNCDRWVSVWSAGAILSSRYLSTLSFSWSSRRLLHRPRTSRERIWAASESRRAGMVHAACSPDSA